MSMARTRQGMTVQINPRTGRARRPRGADATRSTTRLAPYRSTWERTFATYLGELLMMRKITWWSYEPIALRLAPRLRYVPDFWVQHRQPDGLMIYEVKGWSRNRREGIAKLKMAAVMFPWASFTLVEYRGGRMQFTRIPGGHHAADTSTESPTASNR